MISTDMKQAKQQLVDVSPEYDLTIILVTYNSIPLARHCLRSIEEHRPNLKMQYIVVDNASRLQKEERVLPEGCETDLRYIAAQGNHGFAKSVNHAIGLARSTYTLVLNPDLVVQEGAIDSLFEYMEEHPEVGVAGPRLFSPDGEIQESCRRFIDPLLVLYRRTWLHRFTFAQKKIQENLMMDWDHQTPRDVDWIMGAAMFARMSAVREVGLMDERFFMYFEDVDWCRRFWETGYHVRYYPKSEMIHYHQRMSARRPGLNALLTNRVARVHLKSGLLYFLKYWRVSPPTAPQLSS